MSVKGDSVFHFKLIYLLLFKLYTYLKIILFLALFFLCYCCVSTTAFFLFFFWQSYEGISIA